jgi:hypothetical protein
MPELCRWICMRGVEFVNKTDQRIEDRDPKRAVGFAAMPVFPGEDQEEFDVLRDELYLQYEPVGPIEEDAVEAIAAAIWRKRHLGAFQRAFEAQMRWGSHFHYPGDPFGDQRIIEANRAETTATFTESLADFAIKLQANEIVGFDAVNLDKTEDIGQNLIEQFSKDKAEGEQTTKDASDASLVDNNFIKLLTRTLTTVGKDAAGKCNNRPIDPDIISQSMKRAAKEAVEDDLKKSNKRGKGIISPREQIERQAEALHKLSSTLEKIFGSDRISEFWEQIGSELRQQSLAKFGDLLTPECYLAELRFIERLDATIKRNYNWLMKLQAKRTTKKKSEIPFLQPDWTTRRR